MDPTDSVIDPADGDEQIIEIEAEDEPGFVQVGHWILFNHHLSPVARCLYGELAAFVNRGRRRQGDTDVWPSLNLLAILIGVGKGDQVTPYLDELVQVGAIVRRARYDSLGRRTRNKYGVRFNPPAGHTNHLGVIMAHLRPIADDPKLMAAEAKATKAVIKTRREQAKSDRALDITGPEELAPAPYPIKPASDKTAGGKAPQKTGGRPPKNWGGPPKKSGSNNTQVPTTGREQKGEEGARAREIDPPNVGSTTADEEWGIAPTERPAADQGTLLARTVITQIAEETGLGLEPWQHKRLVLEHLPAALDAVRALGDDAVSPTELLEWLAADHDTTMSLYAVLSRRCAPDYLRQALPVWVARTRTPGGLPAPSKPTAPRPRTGGPDGAPDPFTRAGAPPTCLIHPGIALTADATGQRTRCHMCEAPPEPAPIDDSPTPDVEDLADVIGDALPDTEPDLPDHCGNRSCHEHRRHIIRFNPTTQDFQDLGPCPRCHPNRAQEPAA